MKKLLLLLLCVPLLGFVQDEKLDKIIFTNGDTINGSIIEVGVNDIKYRHKGEGVNYVSKKTKVQHRCNKSDFCLL